MKNHVSYRKLTAALTALAMTAVQCALLPGMPAGAAASESEGNDTLSTANAITAGDKITGVSDGSDPDYFCFTLNEDEAVQVTFDIEKAVSTNTSSKFWTVQLLSDGGGVIAERRIMTLAEFDFRIHVVAEELTETLQQMVEVGIITWKKGRYQESDLQDADIVAACTNNREVNKAIGLYCKAHRIEVSVCDARAESTFWFPAIAINDELTMGLVGNGKRHDIVKQAASALRRIIEERSYEL